MRQPRPASPSEDHQDDERKLHLAENLWKALVFVFAELKAIARFIWRSPHHFDSVYSLVGPTGPESGAGVVGLRARRRYIRKGAALPAGRGFSAGR